MNLRMRKLETFTRILEGRRQRAAGLEDEVSGGLHAKG